MIPDCILSIINEYAPAEYEAFPDNTVVSINSNKTIIEEFGKYKNLKYIRMDSFNGDLSPLKGSHIQKIHMNGFTGI